MTLLSAIDPAHFAHAALFFYVLALLMRDGLQLRFLLLIGTGFYILYYFTIADLPLWDAIWASFFIGVANIYSIIRTLTERTTFAMSAQQKAVFEHFHTMTPGQFRTIMKKGETLTADGPVQLVKEGTVPDALYFVLQGQIHLRRSDKMITIPPKVFIGEISYVQGGQVPASATVGLAEGAEYIKWDRAQLRRLTEQSQPLSNALSALFNRDMGSKLTQSWPLTVGQ